MRSLTNSRSTGMGRGLLIRTYGGGSSSKCLNSVRSARTRPSAGGYNGGSIRLWRVQRGRLGSCRRKRRLKGGADFKIVLGGGHHYEFAQRGEGAAPGGLGRSTSVGARSTTTA